MIPRLLLAAALLAATGVSPLRAQSADTLHLSIADAVTRVLRESDESRLAAAQVEVAEAQITTARASGLPQMRMSGAYSQVVENARATIVGSIFGQSYNYNSNVNLSQTLFQGGRVFAASRAAGNARAAARFNVAETQALLSVIIQRAYLTAILARQLETIQGRNVELAAQRVTLTEQLLAAGRASRYDVLRARVERANLEPALLQARNDRELADIEIRRLLNIPASRPISLTSELDTATLRASVRAVASDTSRDPLRASERAAEMTVNARHEGVKVARADLLPTISAFFQTGYVALPTRNVFPTDLGARSPSFCPAGSSPTTVCQNNGWFPDRNFGVNVQWALFDGLRTKGNIDLAQANERVARLQLLQQRELVAVERAQARAEFTRAEAAFEAQRQNADEAEEAFKIAQLRFERGLSTQLEVSDAQLLLLTARTNAARATIDYYLAVAELARARGVVIPLRPLDRPHDNRTPVQYSTFPGVLVALLLVVQAACDKPSDAAGATKGGAGGAGGRAPPVILGPSDVSEVKIGVLEAGIAINGDLLPIEQIDVRSRVEGDVLTVLAREGDRVVRGQLLARFENELQEGERASAIADLESAKADLANAQWNAEQSAELHKAGAIPERDLRLAQQTLSVAKARLAAAESQLRASSRSSQDTRILSPTTGVVAARSVDAGEHVARGATLFTVVRNDILELEAAVPARQANELKVAQPVRFSTAGQQLEGQVARIAPNINPANRSITVYIQVPNKNGAIKGNSFATGRIIGRTLNNVLIIPSVAVRQSANSNKPFVYRIEGDVVQHQEVELGIADELIGMTQVIDGLSPGDRIIVGNVGSLGRGVQVQVVSNDRLSNLNGSPRLDSAANPGRGTAAPAARARVPDSSSKR